MKTFLAFLACVTIARAQCVEPIRAYEPTRIVGVAPNPATSFVVIALEVGEPGWIDFQWYSASGIPMRPSRRWIDRGGWLITQECYLLPRGSYMIVGHHEATGYVGHWRVMLR